MPDEDPFSSVPPLHNPEAVVQDDGEETLGGYNPSEGEPPPGEVLQDPEEQADPGEPLPPEAQEPPTEALPAPDAGEPAPEPGEEPWEPIPEIPGQESFEVEAAPGEPMPPLPDSAYSEDSVPLPDPDPSGISGDPEEPLPESAPPVEIPAEEPTPVEDSEPDVQADLDAVPDAVQADLDTGGTVEEMFGEGRGDHPDDELHENESRDREEVEAAEPEPEKPVSTDAWGREWHDDDLFLAFCPPAVKRQRNYIILREVTGTFEGEKRKLWLRVGQCTGRHATHALDWGYRAYCEATSTNEPQEMIAVSEKSWHPDTLEVETGGVKIKRASAS